MKNSETGRAEREIERWGTVDGNTFRYLALGSGPPILLLHGLLGFSFSWRHNLEALSKLGTLYAIDGLCAGYSDHPCPMDCGMSAPSGRISNLKDVVGR